MCDGCDWQDCLEDIRQHLASSNKGERFLEEVEEGIEEAEHITEGQRDTVYEIIDGDDQK